MVGKTKPMTKVLDIVTATELFKSCGDTGADGYRLKSLHNGCHPTTSPGVTTVANWLAKARQEIEEPTKQ